MATNEECSYYFHRAQVHIPHAIQLIMLVAKHAPPSTPSLVCLKQVHSVVMGETCSYQHFYNMVKKSPGYNKSMVCGADLQVMIRLEAASPATPSLMVVPASCALHAMVACKASQAQLQGMQALKDRTIRMQCLPIPTHVISPSMALVPSPPVFKVVGPLPKALPPFQMPSNVKRSYGLMATRPDLASRQPLHLQLQQLRAWCTTPIQLDRPGHAMASTTFNGHVNNISLFLGHCHWYQGVAEPDLGMYLDPLKICDLVSMKMASNQSPETISLALETAVLVCKWCMSQEGADASSLSQAITWLNTLSTQVSGLL